MSLIITSEDLRLTTLIGPIFSLNLGGKNFVVINTVECASELLGQCFDRSLREVAMAFIDEGQTRPQIKSVQ